MKNNINKQSTLSDIELYIENIDKSIKSSRTVLDKYYNELVLLDIKADNSFSLTKDNILEEIDKLNIQLNNLIEKRQSYANIVEYINNSSNDDSSSDENISLILFDGKTNYSLSILQAQENERRRIAKDLHDSIIQNMISLIHKTDLSKQLIDIDLSRTKLELEIMSNIIKSTINEMRVILYDLMPMSLDDLGLTLSVKEFAKDLMKINDIKIYVFSNDEPNCISSIIKLSIFRVIQEACNNALKHAKAKEIHINILYKRKSLIVEIMDDGIGFDRDIIYNQEKISNDGMGLSIMNERIKLLSGTLEIKSLIDKGTDIIIDIPLEFDRKKKRCRNGVYMRKIKVIIADDHAMVREGLKQLLELNSDIEVVAMAENGQDTIELLNTMNLDVLLLDINMPVMNAFDVLRYIRDNGSKVKVIILTIHFESEYLMRALDYDVDGYILKDSESAILKKAINVVYNGEKYFQENLLSVYNEYISGKKTGDEKVLTKREKEVLALIAEGLFNKEIAYRLSISEKTVKNHISNIFKKINVSDRTQAAVYAIKNNYIKLF